MGGFTVWRLPSRQRVSVHVSDDLQDAGIMVSLLERLGLERTP
jgi:hypothetical protein